MTDTAGDNVERLDCDTLFFTLDENLKVMPLKLNNFIDQSRAISESGWHYQTMLPGNILVSSTFLAVNTAPFRKSSPMVFETMIFKDGESDGCLRFSNIDDCIEFHHEIVEDFFEGGAISLTH